MTFSALVGVWLLGSASGHGFPMKTAYSVDAFVVANPDELEVRMTFEVPVVEATQALWARFGVRGAGPDELEAFTRSALAELEQQVTVKVDGELQAVDWAARPTPANGKAVGGFVFYYLDGQLDWPGGELDAEVTVEVDVDGWYDKDVYVSGDVDARPGVTVLDNGPAAWLSRDECLDDGTDHPAEGAFADVLRAQIYRLGPS